MNGLTYHEDAALGALLSLIEGANSHRNFNTTHTWYI